MQIELKKENDRLTVLPAGKLDTVTAPEFEETVTGSLEGVRELVLDLKDLPYTSSAGLRVFLKLQKIMAKQGEMKVLHVCDDVMDIFEMTGFSDILTIQSA